MAASYGGLEYEGTVRAAVEKAASVNDNIELLPDATAGFNANEVDLKVKIKRVQYNIEIKSSPNDQMGGTSLQYRVTPTVDISPTLKGGKPTLDYDTFSLIKEALNGTEKDVLAFIKFIKSQPPIELHKKINGFPMSVSKYAWELATKEGLLKPLNKKVRFDTSFICRHYAKKNCFYIQIGGAGFFYMDRNPLGLDIPRLSGEIDIEIRAARAGSTMSSTYKMETAGAGMRAQARLKTSARSPYSLDNPDHVLMLFGK